MPNPPNPHVTSPRGVAVERLSDRVLAARAGNDETAFAELVRRYREPLRRHAARYVGEADAEDVVQQALVNASLALRKQADGDIELRPWLYRVTTNAAIDHQRARAARPLGDRVNGEPELERIAAPRGNEPQEVIESRDAVRALVARMRSLAPNQRRAATARFLEGRSHDEIAGELGVTPGAARELIHRARRNLHEAIPVLSPAPLLARLRDALAPLLPGGVAPPVAKLAAGAAVAAVAVGGGAAALHATRGPDLPALAAEEASAPAAAVAAPPRVSDRPRSPRGGANGGGRGARDGVDRGVGDAPTSSRQGGYLSATGQPAASSASPSRSGSRSDSSSPVHGLTDALGGGGLAESLGIGEVLDQLPSVPDTGGGASVPALPDTPKADAPTPLKQVPLGGG